MKRVSVRKSMVLKFILLCIVVSILGTLPGCITIEDTSLRSIEDIEALSEQVPDVPFDIYTFIKQDGPTIIPGSILGLSNDLSLDSIALWCQLSGGNLIISGGLRFTTSSQAANIYQQIPETSDLWTKLDSSTIYFVIGSGSVASGLKTAISNNRFKKYDNSVAIKEVSMLPDSESAKLAATGIAIPGNDLINLVSGYIGSEYSASVNQLVSQAKIEAVVAGLYAPKTTSIADLILKFKTGDAWDSDIALVAIFKSSLSDIIVGPIIRTILHNSGYQEIQESDFMVYKTMITISDQISLPLLIRVDGNRIYAAMSGRESYAMTVLDETVVDGTTLVQKGTEDEEVTSAEVTRSEAPVTVDTGNSGSEAKPDISWYMAGDGYGANPRTGWPYPFSLQWEVFGADEITITPEVVDRELQSKDRIYGEVNETTTFTLTARNENGTVSAEAIVYYRQPDVEINYFTFSTAAKDSEGNYIQPGTFSNVIHVKEGEPVTLVWDVSGVEYVTIEPDIGEVSPKGSAQLVFETRGTNYTLIARNDSGKINYAKAEATVDCLANAPILDYFVGPTFATESDTINLAWFVSNKMLYNTTAKLYKQSVNTDKKQIFSSFSRQTGEGTATDTPTENTTYTLEVENPEGLLQKSLTVRVDPRRPDKYLFIELDRIYIEDDHDPSIRGAGDMNAFTTVSTSGGDYFTQFPVKRNYLVHDREYMYVNQPIFCAPEGELGDTITITTVVVDNDDLPAGVDWTLRNVAGRVVNAAISYFTGMPGVASQFTGELADQAFEELADWLNTDDIVGLHTNEITVHADPAIFENRMEGFQEFSAGDMIVRYKFWFEEPVESHPVRIKLRPIYIKDDRDGWTKGSGDIYLWIRTADGFEETTINNQSMYMLNDSLRRSPTSGTTGKDSGEYYGSSWGSDGTQIFYSRSVGPFVFFEVGVWDKDDVDADDMLGIYADWIIPPAKGEKITLRRNMDDCNIIIDVIGE